MEGKPRQPKRGLGLKRLIMKYTARQDLNGLWYVDGPGMPGYYGSTANPWARFEKEAVANITSKSCCLAYQAGYKQAQEDIRKSLGMDAK